ncbi:hypothetical protein D083_2398 [Dickeya solani RNS 08.23.3.1.A]|nr:hypothetical protein D083_2398 [Dickeya solani RNS 08.23.3.1.A]
MLLSRLLSLQRCYRDWDYRDDFYRGGLYFSLFQPEERVRRLMQY